MQSLNGSQGILENKPNLQTYNNKPTKQKPNPTPKTTKKKYKHFHPFVGKKKYTTHKKYIVLEKINNNKKSEK